MQVTTSILLYLTYAGLKINTGERRLIKQELYGTQGCEAPARQERPDTIDLEPGP